MYKLPGGLRTHLRDGQALLRLQLRQRLRHKALSCCGRPLRVLHLLLLLLLLLRLKVCRRLRVPICLYTRKAASGHGPCMSHQGSCYITALWLCLISGVLLLTRKQITERSLHGTGLHRSVVPIPALVVRQCL